MDPGQIWLLFAIAVSLATVLALVFVALPRLAADRAVLAMGDLRYDLGAVDMGQLSALERRAIHELDGAARDVAVMGAPPAHMFVSALLAVRRMRRTGRKFIPDEAALTSLRTARASGQASVVSDFEKRFILEVLRASFLGSPLWWMHFPILLWAGSRVADKAPQVASRAGKRVERMVFESFAVKKHEGELVPA